MTQSAKDIKAALSELSSKIALAAKDTKQDVIHDLSTLPAAVDALCHDISQLPKDQQKQMQVLLAGLVEELDNLTRITSSGLEDVRQKLGESSTRQRAFKAYGSPPKK